MRLLDMQPAPLLLGFVLGPLMEENLRRALLISRGDFMVFLERPISAVIAAMTAALLAWAVYDQAWRSRRKPQAEAIGPLIRDGAATPPKSLGRPAAAALCSGGLAAYAVRQARGIRPSTFLRFQAAAGTTPPVNGGNVMTSQIKVTGLAAALAVAIAAPAAANDVRMMTGPQGGSWIPIGGQLKDMWEKAVPGMRVQVMPGAGIANVRGIEEGKADVGMANSISTADAMTGREPFKKPHGNVCNVATLYPQYFQFVVLADAGINKISDLKGKSLTTQQRGNTGEVITRHFLEAHGLKYSDMKVSFVGYSDSVNQMKDGHAVAFGLNTQAPAGAVMDIAAARQIKFFEQKDILKEMQKLNPGYRLITLPKGTYPKQDKDSAGDRLLHPCRGVVQAAGGPRLCHDQGNCRQHQAAGDRGARYRHADAEGHGAGHRGQVPPRRRPLLQGAVGIDREVLNGPAIAAEYAGATSWGASAGPAVFIRRHRQWNPLARQGRARPGHDDRSSTMRPWSAMR
jgi:uncharacterized protein